jgi:hypothetical protein
VTNSLSLLTFVASHVPKLAPLLGIADRNSKISFYDEMTQRALTFYIGNFRWKVSWMFRPRSRRKCHFCENVKSKRTRSRLWLSHCWTVISPSKIPKKDKNRVLSIPSRRIVEQSCDFGFRVAFCNYRKLGTSWGKCLEFSPPVATKMLRKHQTETDAE